MSSYVDERLSDLVEASERAKVSIKPKLTLKAKQLVHGGRVIERVGEAAAKLVTVESKWVDVTPEMATQWLERNFRNRSVSDATVKAYARDMVGGTWIPTHQGIAFNNRDELIDGQHRLHAVVRSDLTIRMMVTYGLPAKLEGKPMTTMDAVDRGRTRSVADQLKVQHGISNGSIIAAICATLGGICYGERTRRLTVGQTLEIFYEFQVAIEFMVERRPKIHGLKAAGVLAAYAFALKANINDQVPVWFKQLLQEESDAPRPLPKLRAFLVSPDAALLNRGTDRGLAELVLQALWMEAHDMPCEQLQMGLDGRDFWRAAQPERVEKIAALFRLPQ